MHFLCAYFYFKELKVTWTAGEMKEELKTYVTSSFMCNSRTMKLLMFLYTYYLYSAGCYLLGVFNLTIF